MDETRFSGMNRRDLITHICELEARISKQDAQLYKARIALIEQTAKLVEARRLLADAQPATHRGRPTLTDTQKARIIALVDAGHSYRATARAVGVSDSTVRKVREKHANYRALAAGD